MLLASTSPAISTLAIVLLVGLLAGILGGLLGIGGGLVMIPALLLILPDAYGPNSLHLYKFASLGTAVVLSIPAGLRHARARAIVYPIVWTVLPLSAIGVLAGVGVASLLVNEYTAILRRLFGLCLILVSASGVWDRLFQPRHPEERCGHCPMPSRRLLYGGAVGAPAGFVSGLLGVGGGIWAVPIQNSLLGIRLRNAIANSTCMIIVVASVATTFQGLSIARMEGLELQDGLWLSLWLSPGAVVGGWIGAILTHALPVGSLRVAFLVVMAITGVRLLA